MPKCVAKNNDPEAAVSAENPPTGLSFVILVPKVVTMRHRRQAFPLLRGVCPPARSRSGSAGVIGLDRVISRGTNRSRMRAASSAREGLRTRRGRDPGKWEGQGLELSPVMPVTCVNVGTSHLPELGEIAGFAATNGTVAR
jgi:hypothetical protein